jgi:hypothetical protein
MSFEIVRHSFVMVFGNLRDSIKVSLVPLLVTVLATFVLPPLFGLSTADVATAANVQAMMEGHPAGPMASVVGLLLAALYFFSMSWIAVGWHRFILLEEYPRFLPQLPLREVLGYLGRSFAIGVVVVIVGIPVGLIGGAAAGPFAAGGGVLIALVVIVLMASILTYVWLRFGIVLPAAAVGQPMPLLAGWKISGPIGGTIFTVSLVLVALNLGINMTVPPLLGGIPIIGQLVTLAVSWTTLMVGASILTTLYGHLVEKRDLV